MNPDQLRAGSSSASQRNAASSLSGMRFGLPGGRGAVEPDSPVTMLELVRTAEALGYDCLWLGEEHFSAAAGAVRRCPRSVLVLAGAIAAVTSRIRIGFTPLFPSLHDPIRLAEELATLDRLSGGRVNFGIGWPHQSYIEAFGRGSDPATVDQTVAAIIAFWGRQPLSLSTGTFMVEPAPLQQPHPPIYVLSPNKQTSDWAASRGYAIILSAFQPDAVIGRDLRAFADSGGDVANSPVARFCLVAESDAAARAVAWPLVVALCERLRGGGLAAQAYRVSQEADLDPEHFYQETAIIGGPETVARRVASLRDGHGVRYINLRPSFWGTCPLPSQQTTVELFATEVVPRLG